MIKMIFADLSFGVFWTIDGRILIFIMDRLYRSKPESFPFSKTKTWRIRNYQENPHPNSSLFGFGDKLSDGSFFVLYQTNNRISRPSILPAKVFFENLETLWRNEISIEDTVRWQNKAKQAEKKGTIKSRKAESFLITCYSTILLFSALPVIQRSAPRIRLEKAGFFYYNSKI